MAVLSPGTARAQPTLCGAGIYKEAHMPGYDLAQDLGEHEVTVLSTGLTDKDGDGTSIVVNCTFQFADGERGLKDLYPCATDKAAQITRKSLKAMGFDMDKNSTILLQEKPELLKGNKVRVVVEEHEYNGKITNRITWINAIKKPAPKASIANLDARLRNVKNVNAGEEL